MVQLAPIPKQFVDSSGVPYAGGAVDIFYAGDTRRANVYADAEGKTIIQNPVILDSHGAWKGFVDPEAVLDYVIKSREGNVVFFFPQISVIQRGSIGRFSFKNWHNFVPDSRYVQFKDFNGEVVVTLCDTLQEWLATGGYLP